MIAGEQDRSIRHQPDRIGGIEAGNRFDEAIAPPTSGQKLIVVIGWFHNPRLLSSNTGPSVTPGYRSTIPTLQ